MNSQDPNDRLLDELLTGHYATLREMDKVLRERVLSRAAAARAETLPGRIRLRRLPWAVLAAAAGLLIAAGLGVMMISPVADHAYGLETMPERFFGVQTIVIRGTQHVHDEHNPQAPVVKIPTEILVKRPDKYRHTTVGVGQSQKGVEIWRGMRYCDGRHNTFVNLDKKEYFAAPISPLDAQLKTEAQIQVEIASDILGPPRDAFQKLRAEKVGKRNCDVYESRVYNEGTETTWIETMWFDPATGLPVRLTFDEVQEDGTVRRDRDYDEIAVNVPLDDALFAFRPPADFRPMVRDADVDKDEAGTRAIPPLDLSATSCGSGFGTTIESWNAFRLSERSMLVVWRRSEPEPSADGSRDWLSNVEIKIDEPGRAPPRHAWFYQSGSPDKWNWSLVSTVDGPLPDNATEFILRAPLFEGTNGMFALRFSDADLEKFLAAAGEAMLPVDARPHTLEALRAAAGEQVNAAQPPR